MTDLEKHYLIKKLELNREAENTINESNICNGLSKDYILALIFEERRELSAQVDEKPKKPISCIQTTRYRERTKEEAVKLMQNLGVLDRDGEITPEFSDIFKKKEQT